MDALVQVREGAPLASALAGKKRFPGILAMFSRLGEQTGQLPQMLDRAAKQLAGEVQRRALQMATILEPLLIVGMGGGVMLIVLAVLLPIIQLNSFVDIRTATSRTVSAARHGCPLPAASPSLRRRADAFGVPFGLTLMGAMPASLEGQLVVAISSRALFDFEEENEHFEANDDRAYMQLQLERIDSAAKPGVAFSLVQKLLAFNDATTQRVEVVILSRNDPVSGMRVFRSAQAYGMPIQRGVFTRGGTPWRYLKPLAANLFLSANEADVRSARPAFPRRASIRTRRARLAASRKVGSPSTRRGALLRRAERVFQGAARRVRLTSAPVRRPLAAGRSSRCCRRCSGCSTSASTACASAPRWSRRAAHRRTSARSAR